jgi:hypothetical protein
MKPASIFIITCFLSLLPCAAADRSKPTQTKPSIPVIRADDLGETTNLAATMPENVAEMKMLLEKRITDGRSTPGIAQKNDVEVVRYPRAIAPEQMAKAAE